MKARKECELCGGEASLHCEADSAFLCWACDARVHGANFLVARHPRRLLCIECGGPGLDDRRIISGPGFLPVRFLCRSCDRVKQGDDQNDGCGAGASSDSESSSCCSSSLSSSITASCVSTAESGAAAGATDSAAAIVSVPVEGDGPIKAACYASSATNPGGSPRRRGRAAGRRDLDARTEDVLLSWCRRMRLDGTHAPGVASHALGVGLRRMAAAPFRVLVAAAVWFAAKLCYAEEAERGRRGVALLRGLEACSGVPATLIVVAEARLARAMRSRHVAEEEEGERWAECSRYGTMRRKHPNND